MKPKLFCILCLSFLVVLPLRAQEENERTATEQRLRELQEQIRLDEQRLSEAQNAEQATLQTLQDLDRELAIRRELTQNYQMRVIELAAASDSLEASMEGLDVDLDDLKQQYRARAIHAYKYGRLHDLALILSASSINQMLIRIRYLNRFTDQRRTKLESLLTTVNAIEERRTELREAREETEALLRTAEAEQQKMASLQRSRQGVIEQLQTQQSTITEEINQKRTAVTEFENRLQSLISAETARRRTAEASDPNAASEYLALSGSFLQNRGRLPWPSRGVVVEPYGELRNPIHGTTTPNPGVLIATQPQAEVRAVFDGVVLGVSVRPEFGTYIAIQHGEYQTVYSNFSMVYVGEGTQIKAGDVIGRAGTDAEPKQAGIFFGLFHNGSAQDPVPWLRRQ